MSALDTFQGKVLKDIRAGTVSATLTLVTLVFEDGSAVQVGSDNGMWIGAKTPRDKSAPVASLEGRQTEKEGSLVYPLAQANLGPHSKGIDVTGPTSNDE